MKKVLIISICNILVLFSLLFSQNVKIDQKEGLYQNQIEKHIVFNQFDEFKISNEEIFFSEISKTILFNEHLYILDSRQSKILVFSLAGELIAIIGQPGQGPGDLEYPRDFLIGSDGKIYVINAGAQRIEVISKEGTFLKRIKLTIPKDIIYSHLSGLLVNQEQRLYITYNISDHLIDEYQSSGDYIRTLVEREDPIKIPSANIGNSSSMSLLNKSNDIIHFDCFTGIFSIISQSGSIKTKFSAYDLLHQNQMTKILDDIKKTEKPILSIQVFELWSPSFCINDKGFIFSILRLKEKNASQKFYVFSIDGTFLYHMKIPFFEKAVVDQIYFYDNTYIFITIDHKIYFHKGV